MRPRCWPRSGRWSAINSAVEIDLAGQVNSEAAGGRRIGAIGGQVDFLRAAAGGGKPILALPAKRIVRELSGPVSTARSDVDWVVTEHGARSLAGLTAAPALTRFTSYRVSDRLLWVRIAPMGGFAGSASAEIAAPLDLVYATVSDIAGYVAWQPGLDAARSSSATAGSARRSCASR